MARDRFIRWTDDRQIPSLDQIAGEVRAYLGDLASREFHESNRTTWTLPGSFIRYKEKNERWIEVVLTKTSVDVVTRHQDGPTNDIADGLARLIARRWGGDIDPSDLSAPKEKA